MLGQVKAVLKSDYVLGHFLKKRYERRFLSATNTNLFHGIYPDYVQALANVPTTKPSGYDNPESAQLYVARCSTIHSTDYPVLYWLGKILKTDSKLFEIGGHIGVSFYAYDQFMGLGDAIDWTIHDVEAVVEQGIKFAKQKAETRLHFTSQLEAKPDTDIVFASGSLQYIADPLIALMQKANVAPQHVLINLLPVNDKPDYFTINNIGTAFCPYKISSREMLISQMLEAGYSLQDEWENPNKRCIIPYQDPSYSLHSYSGFYFTKKA